MVYEELRHVLKASESMCDVLNVADLPPIGVVHAITMLISPTATTFENMGLGEAETIIKEISKVSVSYTEQFRAEKERRKNLN